MGTPNFNFPYPSGSDACNVPQDIQALAEAVDTLLKGTELYKNINGTTGQITLNQDCSNFNRLRIKGYVVRNSGETKNYFEKIVFPGENAQIFEPMYQGGTNTFIATQTINVNGTSVTRDTQYAITIPGNVRTTENHIYITEVIGLNY